MHATPATVWVCDGCGSVFRDPSSLPTDLEAQYREDEYPERELTRLRTRALTELTADQGWWRAHALRPGDRVLEIGSYVGGFLTFARAVGCDAVGVDVGRQVSEFTRDRGLDVETGCFDADAFEPSSFDAVFVLNCIEQLPDPSATLAAVRRVLRPAGLLALRTPSADFVRHAHDPRWRVRARTNGALGVPFVRCWSAGALHRLLRRSGFTSVSTTGSTVGRRARRRRGPTVAGAAAHCPYPWMDVIARRAVTSAGEARPRAHARSARSST
jgi:SAM-dependent methyltransferase